MEGPFLQRGVLTAPSCTGVLPPQSCCLLLLRLQVHLGPSLRAPCSCPSLPAPPRTSAVPAGLARRGSRGQFFMCGCLAMPVSVSQHLLGLHYRISFSWHITPCPPAQCWGQLHSPRGLRSDPLAAFHSGGLFLGLPPTAFSGSSPFGLSSLCFASVSSLVHLPFAPSLPQV